MLGALGVKTGQVDYPELFHFTVALALDDVGFGEGFLEFHNVARDGDHLALVLAVGNDSELYVGPLLAADQLHNLVDGHVQQVGGLLVAGVLHSHHLVAGMDEFAAGGGAALHDADDGGVAVIHPQHGADAGELHVFHVDFEILHLMRAHEIRVRIIGAGHGAKIQIHDRFHVVVLHVLEQPLIAPVDLGVGFFKFLGVRLGALGGMGELVAHQFKLDALAPQFAGLSLRFGPSQFGPDGVEFFLLCEIQLARKNFADVFLTFLKAGEEAFIDFRRGFHAAEAHLVVQSGGVLGVKFLDVLGQKNHVAKVQRVQIVFQVKLRERVVQGRFAKVQLADQAADAAGNPAGLGFG